MLSRISGTREFGPWLLLKAGCRTSPLQPVRDSINPSGQCCTAGPVVKASSQRAVRHWARTGI